MKCMTECPLSYLKVEMEFRAILLNHILAGPLSVVGNTLYIISLGISCRCMRVLNDSRWSHRSFDPLYVSTWGIRNLDRRGQDVTCAVKGELVRWTSSSKLVDTRLLIVFIIMSILSFIICIFSAMRIAPLSSSDWKLVSSCWSCLLAALFSSWSSHLRWSSVGRWLSLCSLSRYSSCWSLV